MSVLLVTLSLSAQAQLQTSVYYDGYWSKWKRQYSYMIYGNYSGFVVYYESRHPSDYYFKFKIDSYTAPTKEDVKYHYKNKIWYEYSGYVEYFINDNYPTIKSSLKACDFPYPTNRPENITRTAKATIKIAPYKKRPRVYNILFEDVGIAMDLGEWKFKQ